MDGHEGTPPGLDTLGAPGKHLRRGPRTTARAVLALALAGLLLVTAAGASAQTATPTPAATPAPAPAATGNDSSTSTDVRSPTNTSTEVRSPTSTSTEAHTADNVTVTGGAGDGDTIVTINPPPEPAAPPSGPAAQAPPLGPAAPPLGPAAPPRTACQYALGFATLHDLIPAIVGDCRTDEAHNPANGDGWQDSAGGLLVWRKADNWTAFTDGFRTWINGPAGIQQRLNTLRYSWEANPTNLPAA